MLRGKRSSKVLGNDGFYGKEVSVGKRMKLDMLLNSPVELEEACVSFRSEEREYVSFESDLMQLWDEETLVQTLVRKLLTMVDENAGFAMPKISPRDAVSIFYSKKRQHFPMEFYVRRLVEYMDCSTSAYLLALVYMKRIIQSEEKLVINELSVHRLLITALVLAVKFLDDHVFSNEFYSKVGGLANVREINQLEAGFLNIMKFQLAVDADEFLAFQKSICLSTLPSSPLSDFQL